MVYYKIGEEQEKLLITVQYETSYGALVAKCSNHLPFTSKVAGSTPGKILEPSPHVKSTVNGLPNVVGFLRMLRLPPNWLLPIGLLVGSRCCGDPALVAKLIN